MAVGTYLNGIIIINNKLQMQNEFTKLKGLQNNTIGSLFYSKNKQLWAGTYNGIDMIDLGSAFSNIYPDGSLQGTVYATVIFNQKMYCGTENGLYVRPLTNNTGIDAINFQFLKLKGSEGQVWGLDVIKDDLIMSHNHGAFVVINNVAKKISSYFWLLEIYRIGRRKHLYCGSYTGLFAFRKNGNNWQEIGKISGFDESCRIMVKDGKSLWIAHPYSILYRLDINWKSFPLILENFGQENGLPGRPAQYGFRVRKSDFGIDRSRLF